MAKAKKVEEQEKQVGTTHQEILELRDAAKVELNDARTALKAYLTDNKLKKNKDYSDDKVHGKEYKQAKEAIAALEERLSSLNDQLKATKVTKPRNTKYEYPEGMTDPKERKAYRVKMRAEAKKAAKGENTEETPKKEKKAKAPKTEKKVEEAPVEEKTTKKKAKPKAKKSKAPVED